MKRWTLRILVCLIFVTGGAITTVAVAWGIAYFLAWDIPLPDEPTFALHAEDRPTHHILVCRWMRIGSTTVWVVKGLGASGNASHSELSQTAPSWCRHGVDMRRDESLGAFERVWSFFEARGWPMVAMSCEQLGAFTRASGVQQLGLLNGIQTDRATVQSNGGQYVQPKRILPLALIWPGFVIDTLFYAAIWFVVPFGFASVKRIIRAKRGRCPRCGYDLRGARVEPPATSPGCPECGWGRAGDVSVGETPTLPTPGSTSHRGDGAIVT